MSNFAMEKTRQVAKNVLVYVHRINSNVFNIKIKSLYREIENQKSEIQKVKSKMKI